MCRGNDQNISVHTAGESNLYIQSDAHSVGALGGCKVRVALTVESEQFGRSVVRGSFIKVCPTLVILLKGVVGCLCVSILQDKGVYLTG